MYVRGRKNRKYENQPIRTAWNDGSKMFFDLVDLNRIKNTDVVPRVSSQNANNSGRNQQPVFDNNIISENEPIVKKSVKENGDEADINEIVNSDMTADEKRKALKDRAHFVPRGGRDLYTEAQQKGKEHFDKMHKVRESDYSEDDWKSYGEQLIPAVVNITSK